MPESPATRLLSLNQQAIAILRLGVPLDLGLGSDSITKLVEINERLASRVRREHSIEEMLANDGFPKRYEEVARMLLAADDPTPIFHSLSERAENMRESARPLQRAITEPVVVFVLAYFGLIFICLFVLPGIEEQYEQAFAEPSGFTVVAQAVRDSMSVWVPLAPIVLLVFVILWRRYLARVLPNVLPGMRSYARCLAAAAQTRRLAALVGGGMNADEAVELARDKSASAPEVGPVVQNILHNEDAEARPAMLQRLVKFYRYLAGDQSRSVFTRLPAMLSIFLAGAIVLSYALFMFLPWIEVLESLSNPIGRFSQ